MTRNPFCAARFAPGVLPWIGDLDPLVDRVCRPSARLQIVGPHGSGKSTLLVHLARRAAERGFDVRSFRGSQGFGALDRAVMTRPLLVLADEIEELGAVRFALLRAWCSYRRAAFVITAHRDMGFETLCERSVDGDTVRALVERLSEDYEVDDIDDLLRHHDGNVREVFFALYDRVQPQSDSAIARVRT